MRSSSSCTLPVPRRVAMAVLLALQAAASSATPSRPLVFPDRPLSPAARAAFGDAGKRPGLEIWRIENSVPVACPKDAYGKFYSGNSYIVLETRESSGTFSYDLFFWLGHDTTQDEAAAAATLTVDLDRILRGVPVQHREEQGRESKLFLDNFPDGVQYLPGGVSGSFQRADTTKSTNMKRLYQVKGTRVRQVNADVSSMNMGDCFVLDTGEGDVLVYVGFYATRVEEEKAAQTAQMIRRQRDDLGRHVGVSFINEELFLTTIGAEVFFEALGSGSPGKVPEQSAGGEDADYQ